MTPEESVVIVRAAFSVFILVCLYQLLSSHNSGVDLSRCEFSKSEFGAKRERHWVDFSSKTNHATKLAYCADLLSQANLNLRAVDEMKNGNFEDTAFDAVLWLSCGILQDARFLRAHSVCAAEFQHVPWDEKVFTVIGLLNSVLPVWFECADSHDPAVCDLLQPYLTSLQKLSSV
jgi:hypothetical protein